MPSRWLYRIHSYTGLLAGVFVLIMSVSGAILLMRPLVQKARLPEATVYNNRPWLTIDSAYNLVKQKYPNTHATQVILSQTSEPLYQFRVQGFDIQNEPLVFEVYIHAQTGRLLTPAQGFPARLNSLLNFARRLHGNLLLHKTGEWLLAFFGILFIISLISGIFLYWKELIAFFSFRKKKKTGLHQWVGVLAIVANLFFGISGCWMQRYVWHSSFYIKKMPVTLPKKAAAPGLAFSLDNALQKVRRQYKMSIYTVYYPSSPAGNIAVYGSRQGNSFIYSKQFSDAVFLDSTGDVKRTAFLPDIPGQDRYDIANAQLHEGLYAPLPLRLLYFLFGLSGAILSITGYIQFIHRQRRV